MLLFTRIRIREWIRRRRLRGQRLARQRLVGIRRSHENRREHDRGLPQIERPQMIEGIQIGVMNPGLVIQWILDELERGQSETAEEDGVCCSSWRAHDWARAGPGKAR